MRAGALHGVCLVFLAIQEQSWIGIYIKEVQIVSGVFVHDIVFQEGTGQASACQQLYDRDELEFGQGDRESEGIQG